MLRYITCVKTLLDIWSFGKEMLQLNSLLVEFMEFYVWLAMYLGIIFVNNQIDAQFFFVYVYFYSLHVSDSYVSIIKRINCINTSGIYHSV